MPMAKARASPKNTRRIIAILFSADVMAVAIRRQAKTPTPPKRQNRSPNSSVRFSIDVYDRAFLPKPGRQYGPSTRTVGYRLNNAFNRQWQIAENDFSGNYRTFAAGEHDGDLDQPGVFHVLHPGPQCHGQSSGRPRPDRFNTTRQIITSESAKSAHQAVGAIRCVPGHVQFHDRVNRPNRGRVHARFRRRWHRESRGR